MSIDQKAFHVMYDAIPDKKINAALNVKLYVDAEQS